MIDDTHQEEGDDRKNTILIRKLIIAKIGVYQQQRLHHKVIQHNLYPDFGGSSVSRQLSCFVGN